MVIQSHIGCIMMPMATCTFFGYFVPIFSKVHDAATKNGFVGKVEISFYKENGPELINQDNTLFLLKHNCETFLPLLWWVTRINGNINQYHMCLTEFSVINYHFVMTKMKCRERQWCSFLHFLPIRSKILPGKWSINLISCINCRWAL